MDLIMLTAGLIQLVISLIVGILLVYATYLLFKEMPPFIKGLKKVFNKEGFSEREKLDFLLTFIQNIRYERPGGESDVFLF